MRGFTLLEILLVILIIAFLAGIILPLGFNFYKNQQLQEGAQGILQTLRRAQLKAMSVEGDSSFGVKIESKNYILFRGSSFATRDPQYDEVFDLPAAISVGGLSEVVFSKSEGKPNISGNVVLSTNSESRTININPVGRINYE